MKLTRNITTLFLIRPLGIAYADVQKYGFMNAYTKDVDQNYYSDDLVHLLFKPSNMDSFNDFLEKERDTKDIIDDYDYEGGYVVIVYQNNPLYKSDIDLVKKGLYSKTSKAFQEIFPRVVKIVKNGRHKDEISLQYRIFNKTQDLINFWEEKLGITFTLDQEVWQGFHEEKETLNINHIKQNVQEVSNTNY